MKNSRRPKGEGSITKLPNGKLKMTLTLGVGVDGKQKRKSVTAANKAELMKRVTELRIAIGQPRDTKMYFKDLVEMYLKWNEDTLSSNTLKNYKYMDKVVFSQLYHYRIDKITGEMIDMVLDNINKDKHLKDSTVMSFKTKLTAIFNFAITKGLLTVSPLRNTRKRSRGVKKADRIVLPTKGNLKALLQQAKKLDRENRYRIKFYPLFLLATATGFRIGEILDIDRERDIDLEHCRITIRSQCTLEGHDQPLKTSSSYRTIYVQEEILQTVLSLVETSSKTTKLWHYKGTPLALSSVNNRLYQYFKGNPLVPEGFTFHSFRHYHATQLLLKGINVKEVSKRLGHADIQTTLQLYAHWLPEMDKAASSVIDGSYIC